MIRGIALMRRSRASLTLVWLALVSCGDAGAAAMFEPNRILDVDITMDDANWELLRSQDRGTIVELVASDCLAQPRPNPFTYFSSTVTVDGNTLDTVAVRKKGGLRSLDRSKPSLTIKFAEFVPDQHLSGLRRMTLNNAKQDPSFVKQCIGYELLALAGLPAVRCNFAQVSVNGEDLGLYVHVDAIKKPFLRRQFSSAAGNLYEGALSDFRPEWDGTFKKRSNKLDTDWSDINAVIDALTANDAALLAALDPLIDRDAFMTFWAMEALIAHRDGYAGNANNFYVYRDPESSQFQFIPQGIDSIMADGGTTEPLPESVYATGLLARRLYLLPETRDQYVLRLRELLDSVWNETTILAEIDRMEALITPVADGPELASAIERVRVFVRERRQVLLAELDAGPPPWDEPLRAPTCSREIGDVSGSFDTTFGTLAGPDPFVTGNGAFSGTVNGTPITVSRVGAKAGFDPDAALGTQVQVQVVVQVSITDFVFVVFNLAPDRLAGGTVVLDFNRNVGYLAHVDGTRQSFEVDGAISQGQVVFSVAGILDGDQITGSFSGLVIEPLG